MGNLASLTFMLGANIKDFQTKMRTASQQMAKTGQQMKATGKSMSMYATAPILALGGASLAAFDKQAQAEQKLAAQIRANGKDVETTMASYKKFASSLQNITTVGDETTLKLMQMAETMQSTNVEEATQGAIGLSKALGVDLQSALKMTVLAQKGEYTMLNRYVPALRGATSETEKAAIVAKLYADGLNIAKAEAQTGLGPLKQLQNTIGDISEQFGAIVAEGIKPVVDWLKKAADRFAGLSDRGKKIIVIVMGVVAAIGPMLVIFGTLATLLPTIAAGFAMITGPVGLVVAAIAALAAAFVYVYDNWEAFKERLSDWNWIRNAVIEAVQFMVKTVSWAMREILDLFGIDFVTPMIDSLDALKVETKEYEHEFGTFTDAVKNGATELMDAMGMMGSAGEEAFTNLSNSTKSAHNGFALIDRSIPVIDKLKSKLTDLKKITNDTATILPFNMKSFTDGVTKINSGMHFYEQQFTESWNRTKDNIRGIVTSTITDIGVSLGEALGDMVSGLDPNFGQRFLAIMGQFLKDVGAALITMASLIIAAYVTVNMGPVGAAAAAAIGIAAVAAGKILMNKIKKGPAEMAKGGIVPPGFSGDTYPALLSSGEMVLPNPIPLGAMGSANNDIQVHGSMSMKMDELIVSFDRARRNRTRAGGYNGV